MDGYYFKRENATKREKRGGGCGWTGMSPTSRRGSYSCTDTHIFDSGVVITTGAATEEVEGPGNE